MKREPIRVNTGFTAAVLKRQAHPEVPCAQKGKRLFRRRIVFACIGGSGVLVAAGICVLVLPKLSAERRDLPVAVTEKREVQPAPVKRPAEAVTVQQPEAGAAATPPPPQAPVAGTALDEQRARMWGRLDQDKDGRVTVEELTAQMAKPENAPDRFTRWDKDRDGFVTPAEFSLADKLPGLIPRTASNR